MIVKGDEEEGGSLEAGREERERNRREDWCLYAP